jgi:hypothetical protein
VPLRGAPRLTSAFTFVTPNTCNDTHDCSVRVGDSWLAGWLQHVLRSPEYRSGSMAIFITWDEDDGGGSNSIPTVVVSPDTRSGTRSGAGFNHYSMLATTEDLLGVGRLGAAAGARSMAGAFNLR